MKILLSAYSCLPGGGSEPGIGWNWADSIIACGYEVVVLTRTTGRAPIEHHLQTQPQPSLRFIYHDLPRALSFLYWLPLGNYAYYVLWQHSAANLAVRMHRQERFECVQHVTWGSFRVPSFMGRLGIPFIFGPVGGAEDTPPRLRKGLGFRGRLWDAMRRFTIAMTLPAMKSTYAAATGIVTTTQETLNAIPATYRHKAWSCQAVGIDTSRVFPQKGVTVERHSNRLELLFVGRLLAWKGVHLVLKALSLLDANDDRVHLTVIGDGSDGKRLRRMATRLKLDGRVTWMGWMPREEVIGLYSNFDLFTFPSLHDSGGMAVLEAMALGLPVLCLDLGGPALAVNDCCGHAIPAADRDERAVIGAIALFLREVLGEPEALARLARGARDQAAALTWRANVEAVYEKALGLSPMCRPGGVACAQI